MKTKHRNPDDIDRLWPMQELLDSIGFSRRVGGRVKEYLLNHGFENISFRQLMDQFLPFSHTSPVERWRQPPISRQRVSSR